MTTALITHAACLGHVTPDGHPERVARLDAILHAMDDADFTDLARLEATRAPREAIARVHDERLIDLAIDNEPSWPGQHVHFNPDTAMSQGSVEAAERAAGAAVAAVDGVMSGTFQNAFCAVRPPGHHAERAQAMGFCLFNNAGIAAAHALDAHGLTRVAIVDIDVHHGNGSQQLAYARPEVFFASIHQAGIYPGTGSADETGVDNNVLNAPVPGGTDGPAWRRVLSQQILPALADAKPELVIISAGFDAHQDDPLGGLVLSEDDFAWATAAIAKVARDQAHGRLVSTLEGGYDLDALARSSAAHARALLDA